MHPIIIVGSGLAGYSVAREIRRISPEQPLLLLTEDSGDYYSKPALSNALARKKTPDQLLLTPADAMKKQVNLELLPNTTLTAINPDAHVIETTAGPLSYSKLVLAQGATPIRLQIPGNGARHILSVNDLADYRELREALGEKKSVLIIGAGLIGCEFANDLLHSGIKPIVVDPADWALANLLPIEASKRVMKELSRAGVDWQLGVTVASVHKTASRYLVKLSDGLELDVDLVLSAVGLQPRTTTAAQAGLLVNRGIVVNQMCQSSDPDIYAIGDCAEYPGGAVLPYVAPILAASKSIARTVCIEPTPFSLPAVPVSVKLTSHPVCVYNGRAQEPHSWETEESDFGLQMQRRDAAGRLLSFVLTGECTEKQASFVKELWNTVPSP